MKINRSKEDILKSLISSKSDARGLRYEQKVANYFRQRGWNPQSRLKKYGFEYDLYDKKEGIFSTEYLLVECK